MGKIQNKLRRKLGTDKRSQNEIARLSGVDVAAINRYIRGERGLSGDALEKLLLFYNLG